MKQIVLVAAFITLIGLLAGLLIVLSQIMEDGVTVQLVGPVKLTMPDGVVLTMPGEVILTMPQTVDIIATGPDGNPMPVELAVFPCPQCGGRMIPIRWHLWSGEIEWRCLDCTPEEE
ncbi:hypothetical protein LM597_02515 [Candidatus Acetothermia bacterium]|jgi:hypothetical protein|nr:hypothetical protein [Candidatus Acetothermia bacterium]MCI2426274.1 hypothetical protein [Candidatus Acetothermia bacterium]